MLTLQVKKRDSSENVNKLRVEGDIPAIYYGAGKDATCISVPSMAFAKVFREAGETSAITLDFGTEKVTTLVHDVQLDPLSGLPIHVDFLAIDMNKEVEIAIPLDFIGVSEAEKSGLGNLVKVAHEIKVRALPADLPHSISVDISSLKTLEDKIHVSDLIMSKGVTCLDLASDVVALITPFVEEKEEVSAPIDLSTIEVEKKGKKEEEETPSES